MIRERGAPHGTALKPSGTGEEGSRGGMVVEDLLALAEFRALRLGTWLGTTDGQTIAQAVEMATPPIYRPDVELLVDGLKLAASLQQREGQKIAGLVALGTIAIAGLLAMGGAEATS